MSDKLKEVAKTLEELTGKIDRLWGHYALTKERLAVERRKGYSEGYDAGREAGVAEGYDEAKQFPSANVHSGIV